MREHGVLHTHVEVLRSPASCYSELKLCCELADETNELNTSENGCAVARRDTKHFFSSNFDLFSALTKPSNQTRRVIIYAALRVTRMLESVATVSGWRVTPLTLQQLLALGHNSVSHSTDVSFLLHHESDGRICSQMMLHCTLPWPFFSAFKINMNYIVELSQSDHKSEPKTTYLSSPWVHHRTWGNSDPPHCPNSRVETDTHVSAEHSVAESPSYGKYQMCWQSFPSPLTTPIQKQKSHLKKNSLNHSHLLTPPPNSCLPGATVFEAVIHRERRNHKTKSPQFSGSVVRRWGIIDWNGRELAKS